MKIDESKFRFRIGDKVLYEDKEYTVMAYYFSDVFNDYENYAYGYAINYPIHDGRKKCFDENGYILSFPTKSVFFITEQEAIFVQSPLTIANRLRYAPKGMELYSIAHGKVFFENALNGQIALKKDRLSYSYLPNGKVSSVEDGECVLFPSKDNRDWSTVNYSKPQRPDLPIDTLCIVTDGIYKENNCFFRYYALNSNCYDGGFKSENDVKNILWKHIVPVDKFDFKNLTYNPEDDYGTESECNL